jgi:hypothetical protein
MLSIPHALVPRGTRRGGGAWKLRRSLPSRVWVPSTPWLESIVYACAFDRVSGTRFGVASVVSSQRLSGCLTPARPASSIQDLRGWAGAQSSYTLISVIKSRWIGST